MTVSIEALLAAKGIHPKPENIDRLENKWEEIQNLKGDLSNIAFAYADISLRNLPGGDHVG